MIDGMLLHYTCIHKRQTVLMDKSCCLPSKMHCAADNCSLKSTGLNIEGLQSRLNKAIEQTQTHQSAHELRPLKPANAVSTFINPTLNSVSSYFSLG